MMNTAVIGLQFGDEGKGKIVDYLAQEHDIVARFSGGSNAGHTVIYNGEKIKFHLIPSGVLSGKIGVLGNGMVIDLEKLESEIKLLRDHGINSKILISSRAQVVTPLHRIADANDDEILKIGTTKQGIGPAYVAKYRRIGIHVADLFDSTAILKKLRYFASMFGIDENLDKIAEEMYDMGKRYREMIVDTEVWLNNAISGGMNVLFEGSQGTFLDVDFGTYPYVTSSATTIGGILTGLGVPPSSIHRIVGVAKAYTTRVGGGPFPTELMGDDGETLRRRGGEYGATTGRPRRVGNLDLVLLRYATMINGVTEMVITKADILAGLEKLKVATEYRCDGQIYRYPPINIEKCKPVYEEMGGWKDIYDDALEIFLQKIEKETLARVSMVSYSPERDAIIHR